MLLLKILVRLILKWFLINNDEKLEGKQCGKTLDDIDVSVSVVNDERLDNL